MLDMRRATLFLLAVANAAGFKAQSSHPHILANVNDPRCAHLPIANLLSMCVDSETLAHEAAQINGNGNNGGSDQDGPEEPIYRRLVPHARRPIVEAGIRYRSDDWMMNVLSIPRSYLLMRRIKSHLLFDQLVCLLTLLARKKLGWTRLAIPIYGHELLGSFLGLLLVFRTNSAYSRFAEARGYWADVSTKCRCLALESVSHLRPYAPKSAEKFERLLLAFPDVLAYTCLAGNTKARLPPFEWDLLYGEVEVSQQNDVVVAADSSASGEDDNGSVRAITTTTEGGGGTTTAATTMTEIVDELVIDPSTLVLHKLHRCLYEAQYELRSTRPEKTLFNLHLSTMGTQVNQLSEALSGCEKIVDTPVPLSYSRHASRFLTLWCGFLPLAIVPRFGWLSVPLMGTVSWLLYGLEEIGHLIEQPFVPVTDKPSYLISDDVVDDDRASMTQPYDIGLPICSVAEKIRTEVEKIISIQENRK